jgi:hypothetical protein
MRVLPLRNTCVAVAIVLAIAFAFLVWTLREGTGSSAMTPGPSGEVSESPVSSFPAGTPPVPSAPRPALPQSPRTPPAETRGKGELKTAEFDAFALRCVDDPKLTEEEIMQISGALAALATERGRIESRIGTFAITGPDSLKITIPPFPVEGERLKNQWLETLDRILGTERAASLYVATVSLALQRLSYFGQSNRIYTVSGRRTEEDGTITYRVSDAVVPISDYQPIEGGLPDGGGSASYRIGRDEMDGGNLTVIGLFLARSGLERAP